MSSAFQEFSVSCARYTEVAMENFHQHNEIEFGILDSGSHRAYFGGALTDIPTRRICCGWAMIPHRALGTEACTSYVVTLPLSWFLSRNFPDRFSSAILHGCWLFGPDAGDGEEDVRRFLRWHYDINSGNEWRTRATLLEIEARLLRLASELDDAGTLTGSDALSLGASTTATELGKVERMAAYVATHYRCDLKMAEVAHDVNLHEKYAMQLFRRTCGVTLWQYLTQHRLWHAQRLLATTGLPMIEVAYQAGFGSDSQFYAVFKRQCQISPRQYRASLKR